MGDKKDRAKGQLKEKAGVAKGDPGLAESGRRYDVETYRGSARKAPPLS